MWEFLAIFGVAVVLACWVGIAILLWEQRTLLAAMEQKLGPVEHQPVAVVVPEGEAGDTWVATDREAATVEAGLTEESKQRAGLVRSRTRFGRRGG